MGNFQGFGASLLTHEVMHCFGEVAAASPHFSTASQAGHSANLWASGTGSLINVRTRGPATPAAQSRSVMFGQPGGIGAVSASPISFTEGLEWNRLRQTFLGLPGATARASAPVSGSSVSPRFMVFGSIGLDDSVMIYASQRFDGPLDPTPDDPAGSIELSLLDVDGVSLESTRFEPVFEGAEGSIGAAPFVLVLPLPVAAAQFAISRGLTTLHSESFSALPPTVGGVVAMKSELGEGVDLHWTASHPEGRPLRYSLYYEPAAGETALPIAMGLRFVGHFFDTSMLPPTNDARITVEATDGLNTHAETSNAFAVTAKPPLAAILAPRPLDSLVSSRPVLLEGVGFDPSVGKLTGSALSWKSDLDGPLGMGERIEASLSAGSHTLDLEVVTASGLAEASVQIFVELDGDGDGVSDSVENASPCLEPSVFDGDLDLDGDGLSSLGEIDLGTDPCDPDTDGDGFVDGHELRMASDPMDVAILPMPNLVSIPTDRVDLGACPAPGVEFFDVLAQPAGLAWEASGDADWLLVEGSGIGNGLVEVSANCAGLPAGVFFARVLVAAADAPVTSVTARLANADGDSGADNCLDVENASQLDSDNDGFGNACDCDFDQDGACGAQDESLLIGCKDMLAFPGSECEVFDMTGDGKVDEEDILIFSTRLGSVPGPSALASVPSAVPGLGLWGVGFLVALIGLVERISARRSGRAGR
jgi:hypothetical protein